MSHLIGDFAHGLRTLRKSSGFTVVVVVTLALGIGANTTIFTLLDQVLLRSLPVRDPERLVILNAPGTNRGSFMGSQMLSYPMYADFRDQNYVFEGILARFPLNLNLTVNDATERLDAVLVSGNYFDVLGVRPALGRLLSPDDDREPGSHPVVVLSYDFWARRFGADPSVLNRTVSLNGHAMTVIGVSAGGFHGIDVGSSPDVMVPIMMKREMTPTWYELDNRRFFWLHLMARLRPGVGRKEAETAVNVIYHQLLQDEIQQMTQVSERFRERFLAKRLLLLPGMTGRSELRSEFSTPLLVLMSMVGLVLLIACFNVANLLTARAASRQKEVAIRLALGSGRGRLVSQLLAESLLLALAGGLLGLLLAYGGSGLLVKVLPDEAAARALSTTPDLRVVAFAVLLSALTALLFGLLPAFQSTRPQLAPTLKDESGSVSSSASQSRLRRALVVGQVALSLLLLVGAGLFARSLYNLKNLDPGFRTDHLITFSIEPSLNGYTQERVRSLAEALRKNLSALPGVRMATMSEVASLTDDWWVSTVSVEGYEPAEGENMNPNTNSIGPGYFAAMGIPLLSGREFDERDGSGAPKVAVINQTMAKKYFPDRSPIGMRLGWGRAGVEELGMEIVGVVQDGKATTLRDEIQRFVYTPVLQGDGITSLTFYVRTSLTPESIFESLRAQVSRIDPNLPLFNLKTMELQVEESLFVERTVAALSTGFGLLATLLAALGLYGIMSYAVSRRTREIGIRIALGAARDSVLRLVLFEMARLVLVGASIGLAAAFLAGRLVESQLFGLTPQDPWTLTVAPLLIVLVALAAGYLPALRATRIDPLTALRFE